MNVKKWVGNLTQRVKHWWKMRTSPSYRVYQFGIKANEAMVEGFTKSFNTIKTKQDAFESDPLNAPMCFSLDMVFMETSVTRDEELWEEEIDRSYIYKWNDSRDDYTSFNPWTYFDWDDLTKTFEITESYPKLYFNA